MIKIQTVIYLLLLSAGMCLFFIYPEAVINGTIDGMQICYNRIIPSLFPFTVISLLLYNSGALHKLIPKKFGGINLIIFLMSLFGGYPIGGKLISEAFNNGDIDSKTAQNMLYYCISAGPSFTIGVLGVSLFHSKVMGEIFFVSSLISALVLMLCLNHKNQSVTVISRKIMPISDNFVSAVSSTCTAMLTICGFIIIFSVIIRIISVSISSIAIQNILIFPLEVTTASIRYKNIYTIAFLLGFSGISIILQVISLCRSLKPSFIKIAISRIFGGILTLIFTYIGTKIFKPQITTISNIVANITPASNNLIFVVLFFTACIALIYTVNTKNYCGKITRDIF